MNTPTSLVRTLALSVTLAIAAAVGCGSPEYTRHGGTGGTTGTGGTMGSESGGAIGSGGAPMASGGAGGSGGTPATGSGGAPPASGGAPGTGGAPATGGAASGGAPGSGGATTGGAGGSATGSGGAATGGAGPGGAATGGAATGGSATGGRGTGGAGTGGAATGGAATGGAATGGASTGGAPADPARYNFETTTQSWDMATGTTAFTSIARDTSHHFAGAASLAAAITATGVSTYQVRVNPDPTVPAGATVTAHLFIPSGAPVEWVQVYVQEVAPTYVWTGTAVSYTTGAWATLTVTVPTTGNPIGAVGIQVRLSAAWTGTIYVDSVNW